MVIGQIIQRLYDNGFFVNYDFSDKGIDGHFFRFWKIYEGEQCGATYVISDFDAKKSIASDCFLLHIEHYIKQIDDKIAQQKLLIEVNSIVESKW
jgi:hypothetical protein